MSFDYFNTSYLAFGQKLYSAFATLDSLAKEAKLNIDKIMTYQSLFDDYLNKNYSVPIPQNPESPCRSDNFFDIIDDKPIYINKLTSTQGGIDVQLILVNRNNDRVTRLTGSTSLKEGYCYYKTEAPSNSYPDKEVEFTSDKANVIGTLLFQFRVDKNNILNIVGSTSALYIRPNDLTSYSSVSWGERVANNNQEYTAQDYECLLIKGYYRNLKVVLNNNIVMQGQGNWVQRHCVLYVKKGDKITGNYQYINRINYNL